MPPMYGKKGVSAGRAQQPMSSYKPPKPAGNLKREIHSILKKKNSKTVLRAIGVVHCLVAFGWGRDTCEGLLEKGITESFVRYYSPRRRSTPWPIDPTDRSSEKDIEWRECRELKSSGN